MSLMGTWVAILDDIARGDSADEPSAAALRFDLPRVEGAALACLCSYSPEVSSSGHLEPTDKENGLPACSGEAQPGSGVYDS